MCRKPKIFDRFSSSDQRPEDYRVPDHGGTFAERGQDLLGFLRGKCLANKVGNFPVALSVQQVLNQRQIKFVERKNSQSVLVLRTGDAQLRKVVRPVEDLFNRVGVGKAVADKRQYPLTAIDIEQQSKKESMFRFLDKTAASDKIIESFAVRKNSPQDIAAFGVTFFHGRQHRVESRVGAACPEHLLEPVRRKLIANDRKRQIGRVKIAVLDQLFDQLVGVRTLCTNEGTDSLQLFRRRFLFKEWVNGEARLVVIELRQKKRAFIRADNDRDGRVVEMKQRVNILPSGQDLLHIADIQKIARFEMHVADLTERVHFVLQVKFPPAVDRRTVHH